MTSEDPLSPTDQQDFEDPMSPTTSTTNATSIRGLFSRAANLIREATEVEGVLFLDARGIRTKAKAKPRNEAWTSTESGSSTGDDSSTSSQREDRTEKQYCSILGFSNTDDSSLNASSPSSKHVSIDRRFLRAMLSRYPHGKIFNLEEPSSDSETGSAGSDSANAEAPTKLTPRVKRISTKHMSHSAEAAQMAVIFQGARSLAFFPLWSVEKQQWYAGAVAYTNQPLRALAVESELSYLAAFGNSIMAEVARIDITRAENAKADFISTISHELRSPLHGILGSVELLDLNGAQNSLKSNIEICGRSLLDTVDHLLDHSRINNFVRSSEKQRHYRRVPQSGSQEKAKGSTDGMMMLESSLDFAILCEETFQSLSSSYRSHVPSDMPPDAASPDVPPLSLTMNLECNASYAFYTGAGALRRIITNLCGNALKYTQAGFVHLDIRMNSAENPYSTLKEVELIVSDSGKGISADYQRDYLYTPFTQQDPHSSGTGLGLSIVKSITNSLKGKLSLDSEEGKGTAVQVTLRLSPAYLSPDSSWQKGRDLLSRTTKMVAQKKVSIISAEIDPSHFAADKMKRAQTLVFRSLEALFSSWFDMTVEPANTNHQYLDLTVFTAPNAFRREQRKPEQKPTPTIVICESITTAIDMARESKRLGEKNVHFTTQPLGPMRLASLLEKIFDEVAAQSDTMDFERSKPVADGNSAGERKRSADMMELNYSALKVTIDESVNPKPAGPESESVTSADSNMILLVDDNPINLQLLVAYMKRLKIPYKTATNGKLALDAYVAQTSPRFSRIFMDLSMPVMDGMQSTREIRHYERRNNIKPSSVITALTGLASADAQAAAADAGIDLFLTKPISMKEVERVLGLQ